MLLAGAWILAIASCAELTPVQNQTEENVNGQGTRIEVLGLRTETDTKVTLSGTSFAWQPGDKIAVWTGTSVSDGSFQECTVTDNFSLPVSLDEGKSRYNYAVYPASAAYSFSYGSNPVLKRLTFRLPSSYKLAEVEDTKTPLPMVAVNDNETNVLTFYSVAGLLRLTVNGIPTEDGTYLKIDFHSKIVSDNDFRIDYADIDFNSAVITKNYEASNSSDKIIITELEGKSSVTINIPVPAIGFSDITVSAWNSSDVPIKAQVVAFSYSAARAHGKTIPEISLQNGVFSYGENTYFIIAPANLQYSNGTYSFHENAYDMTFTQNLSSASSDEKQARDNLFNSSGTFDLFSWGTSGKNEKYPWTTSYSTALDLGENWDWGGNNPIGAFAKGTWRTPSRFALKYLIADRPSNNSKCTFGTVNSVHGLILLPDQFTDPQKNKGDGPIAYERKTFETNVYSAEGWEAMKAAGAAFLPAAGKSHYSEFVNNIGYYWTSTGEYYNDSGSSGNLDRAYYLSFSLSMYTPTISYGIKLYDSYGTSPGKIIGFDKSIAAAVRLVHYIH